MYLKGRHRDQEREGDKKGEMCVWECVVGGKGLLVSNCLPMDPQKNKEAENTSPLAKF